jgi:hypothetical protein
MEKHTFAIHDMKSIQGDRKTRDTWNQEEVMTRNCLLELIFNRARRPSNVIWSKFPPGPGRVL